MTRAQGGRHATRIEMCREKRKQHLLPLPSEMLLIKSKHAAPTPLARVAKAAGARSRRVHNTPPSYGLPINRHQHARFLCVHHTPSSSPRDGASRHRRPPLLTPHSSHGTTLYNIMHQRQARCSVCTGAQITRRALFVVYTVRSL
jgi:hypothetical protein